MLPRTPLAPETLMANDAKDNDDNSTDNGSSNGELDPTSIIAAREKTLISHAMDTLTRRVVENGLQISANSANDEQSESDEEMSDMEGPIIEDNLVPFKLSTPTPLPSHLNIHYICETASRLLFLSVHWVRSVPAFSQLK